MRHGPYHRELYSPERDEIERQAEYFELVTKRRAKLATMAAIGLGSFMGVLVVTAVLAFVLRFVS